MKKLRWHDSFTAKGFWGFGSADRG